MERGYRKNALLIDFSVLPAKPSVPVVRKFVFECLKLELSHIQNLQLSLSKSYVYLETKTAALTEKLVAECSHKFFINADGKEHYIPLYIPDGATDVKVKDLPPHMPNSIIAKHLAAYGEVLSIKDDVWQDFFPGVKNGTRIVRMRIKKAIPSYIPMEEEVAFIRYRNQTPTCRYCARNLHIGTKCSDVKKALASSVNTRLTLANIVQGMNPESLANNQQQTPPPPTPMPTLLPAPSISNGSAEEITRAGSSHITTSSSHTVPTTNLPLIPPEEIQFEISDSEDSNNAMIIDPAAEKDPPTKQPPVPNAEFADESTSEKGEWYEISSKRPASPKLERKQLKRQSRSASRK